METASLYYLQNAGMGFLGNAPYWWHETNSGYTPYIDEAKKWTAKDADSQIDSCRGSHRFVKWRVDDVLQGVVRVVDLQLVRKHEKPKASDQNGR